MPLARTLSVSTPGHTQYPEPPPTLSTYIIFAAIVARLVLIIPDSNTVYCTCVCLKTTLKRHKTLQAAYAFNPLDAELLLSVTDPTIAIGDTFIVEECDGSLENENNENRILQQSDLDNILDQHIRVIQENLKTNGRDFKPLEVSKKDISPGDDANQVLRVKFDVLRKNGTISLHNVLIGVPYKIHPNQVTEWLVEQIKIHIASLDEETDPYKTPFCVLWIYYENVKPENNLNQEPAPKDPIKFPINMDLKQYKKFLVALEEKPAFEHNLNDEEQKLFDSAYAKRSKN